MSDTSTCNGCGAPIRWRFTPAGKRMPLDAAPTLQIGQGIYTLVGAHQCRPVDALFGDPTEPRYLNHWATCPVKEQFTAKRGTG